LNALRVGYAVVIVPASFLHSLAAEFAQGIGDSPPDALIMRQVFANALTRGLMPVFSAGQVCSTMLGACV
jgi:hypothetical protein